MENTWLLLLLSTISDYLSKKNLRTMVVPSCNSGKVWAKHPNNQNVSKTHKAYLYVYVMHVCASTPTPMCMYCMYGNLKKIVAVALEGSNKACPKVHLQDNYLKNISQQNTYRQSSIFAPETPPRWIVRCRQPLPWLCYVTGAAFAFWLIVWPLSPVSHIPSMSR